MIAIPSSVSLTTGRGGLPVLQVNGPAARGEIYLHGATVTDWTPAGGSPVLWLGSASRFADDTAIRGGVPICFPWFGARAGHPGAPSHGFARLSEWSLVAAEDDGQDVTLRLRLTDDDQTRVSAWPHRFEAVYTVVFARASGHQPQRRDGELRGGAAHLPRGSRHPRRGGLRAGGGRVP